ncbi:DUF555 domain-containing protein [Salinigranum salinum]|uniref:DUF555 domain-containing protein n=1 Tax=Salinigranum salinum TaxID=1364937 RepID=UPI001260C961
MAGRESTPDSATDDATFGGSRGNASEASSPSSEPESNGWYRVTFSIPWIVRWAESGQDAINVAVSEVGKRVTPTSDLIRNVDISVQDINCANCGTSSDAVQLVTDTALVGLVLTVEAQAIRREKAEAVARREIGPNLPDISLTTINPKRHR